MDVMMIFTIKAVHAIQSWPCHPKSVMLRNGLNCPLQDGNQKLALSSKVGHVLLSAAKNLAGHPEILRCDQNDMNKVECQNS